MLVEGVQLNIRLLFHNAMVMEVGVIIDDAYESCCEDNDEDAEDIEGAEDSEEPGKPKVPRKPSALGRRKIMLLKMLLKRTDKVDRTEKFSIVFFDFVYFVPSYP